MFDKNEYLKTIEHASCVAGVIESSELRAFKIDDEDGIAKAIGFHAGMVSKVDYFVTNNINVQLIELSDLKECIQNCRVHIAIELEERRTANGDLSKREEKEIIKAAWKDIKVEFCKKWNGSIAVIERLYRKTNELGDADPNYALLVVFKNHADIRMLDELKLQLSGQLSGMMGNVKVCNTETLSSFLIGSAL